MTDSTLRIEYLPLTWLIEHQEPDNPKDHDKPAIAASMDEHGFIEPPLLDERTEKVLGGHGRLEVLDDKFRAGHARPDGLKVAPDGGWLVPVVRGVRSEDDDDARRMLVRLNRLSERGGWNAERLTAFDLGDDLLEDDPEGSNHSHADLPPPRKGEPPPPRIAQGLRELVLQLTVEDHREVMDNLTRLSRSWGVDAKPVIVKRALAEAVARTLEPADG
jgi:ParB-like chromosome segregation protein Spo0J